MAEIYSVSLYEINSHSIVDMSQDDIILFVNQNASRIFIDNISINEGNILDFDININSDIEIVCEGSITTGDTSPVVNVTLIKAWGEIVHQRMTKSEVLEVINRTWVFIDDELIVFGGIDLAISENSEIKIFFNDIPHDKILIENHDYPPEQEFRTVILGDTGHTFGSHTLVEINKMITAPDVIVDGEMISFPITAINLHEQSEFKLIPPLRGGCKKLNCGCGGERRHDFRRITPDLVHKGESDNGCWSAEQLCLLGITDECHLGDHETIQNRIGHFITAGNYEKFVNLKNCHLEE